jgi:hypothetical protein
MEIADQCEDNLRRGIDECVAVNLQRVGLRSRETENAGGQNQQSKAAANASGTSMFWEAIRERLPTNMELPSTVALMPSPGM